MNKLHQIYQQYSPDIYRFALGLCGNPAWADDLAAETFVRALVSPKPIRLATVKAYLFTITRNLYLQQLRQRERLVSLEEDSLAALAPDGIPVLVDQHVEVIFRTRQSELKSHPLEQFLQVLTGSRNTGGDPFRVGLRPGSCIFTRFH